MKSAEQNLELILGQMIDIARGNLDDHLPLIDDPYTDPIITGLNMLKEELKDSNNKLAELHEQVKERVNTLRMIFDALDYPILLLDTEDFTVLVHNNRYAERLFNLAPGLPSNDVSGRNLMDIAQSANFSQEKIEDYNTLIYNVVKSRKTVSYEEKEVVAGNVHYYRSRMIPIVRENRVKYLVHTAVPITEDVKLIKNLERSEFQLKKAQEIAGMGNYVFNAQTLELKWTEGLHQIFDLAIDTLPTYEYYMGCCHPEDVEKLSNGIASALEKQERLNIVHRIITSKGEEKILHCYGQTTQGFDGSIEMIGVAHDITSQYRTRQKIEQQNRELEYMNDQLELSNERLKQLAYVTSHDLKTPVINIKALFDLWENSENDPELRKEISQKIRSSVNQMSQTLGDLSSVLEMDSKRQTPEVHQFSDICAELRLEVSALLEEASGVKATDFSRAEKVYFSHYQLKSIILNLLTNAIKYRSPKRDLQIKVSSSIEDNQICMTFEDNGVGIALDSARDRLFGLFQRFHRHVEGKGIGLHVVNSFLKAQGGRLEVESEVDKGSTFKVFFGTDSIPR